MKGKRHIILIACNIMYYNVKLHILFLTVETHKRAFLREIKDKF